MVVVWSKSAQKELRSAYNYIKQYSPQNAEKVRDEIIDLLSGFLQKKKYIHLTNTNQGTMEPIGLLNFIVTKYLIEF